MSRETSNKLIAGALGILMAGNVFFVKKLVDKIEITYDLTRDVVQGLAVLEARFDTIMRDDSKIQKGHGSPTKR